MRLHARPTAAARPCAHASANGLVVIPGGTGLGAADRQVVHAALTGGRDPIRDRSGERAQHDIHDTAAGLDIAGGHGCRALRVEQAAERRAQADRAEGSGAGGGLRRHQTAKDIEDSGRGNRERTIDVAGDLARGARKIDMDPLGRHIEGHPNRDRLGPLAIVVHDVFEAVVSRRNRSERRACESFGIVVECADRRLIGRDARAVDQTPQSGQPGAIGPDLGEKIAARVVRVARRTEDPRQQRLVDLALRDQPTGLNDQPLLVERARDRHRPGHARPDVGMVCAIGDEGDQSALREERGHQCHIRQMRPAEERIVEDHHVAVGPVERADDVRHRVGHAPEVNRDMGGLGAEVPVAIEDRAREIEPIADVRREGRLAQNHTHLLADRLEPAGEKPQFDGIHAVETSGLSHAAPRRRPHRPAKVSHLAYGQRIRGLRYPNAGQHFG